MHSSRPLAALVGAATAVVTLVTALPALAGASTQAPQSLVNASLAAAGKQSSVHYTVFSSAGTRSITLTADVSSNKGQQAIVLRKGKQVGHVNGRLVGGNVYFEGDVYGLTSYLGMPTSLAPKYSGKWIEFTSKESGFSSVSKAFQLSTALSQISIKAPMSISGHSTVNGTSTVNVKGVTTSLSSKGKSGAATLSVSASKSQLPVRFVGLGKQSLGKAYGRVDFSKWGESFTVATPTGAVQASSIAG